jgi:hypothetical protein
MRKITSDPSSLAYHIIRSVPHDSYTVHGNALLLRLGNELMLCECEPGCDASVSVKEIGAGEWRYTTANETDTISRMWSR